MTSPSPLLLATKCLSFITSFKTQIENSSRFKNSTSPLPPFSQYISSLNTIIKSPSSSSSTSSSSSSILHYIANVYQTLGYFLFNHQLYDKCLTTLSNSTSLFLSLSDFRNYHKTTIAMLRAKGHLIEIQNGESEMKKCENLILEWKILWDKNMNKNNNLIIPPTATTATVKGKKKSESASVASEDPKIQWWHDNGESCLMESINLQMKKLMIIWKSPQPPSTSSSSPSFVSCVNDIHHLLSLVPSLYILPKFVANANNTTTNVSTATSSSNITSPILLSPSSLKTLEDHVEFVGDMAILHGECQLAVKGFLLVANIIKGNQSQQSNVDDIKSPLSDPLLSYYYYISLSSFHCYQQGYHHQGKEIMEHFSLNHYVETTLIENYLETEKGDKWWEWGKGESGKVKIQFILMNYTLYLLSNYLHFTPNSPSSLCSPPPPSSLTHHFSSLLLLYDHYHTLLTTPNPSFTPSILLLDHYDILLYLMCEYSKGVYNSVYYLLFYGEERVKMRWKMVKSMGREKEKALEGPPDITKEMKEKETLSDVKSVEDIHKMDKSKLTHIHHFSLTVDHLTNSISPSLSSSSFSSFPHRSSFRVISSFLSALYQYANDLLSYQHDNIQSAFFLSLLTYTTEKLLSLHIGESQSTSSSSSHHYPYGEMIMIKVMNVMGMIGRMDIEEREKRGGEKDMTSGNTNIIAREQIEKLLWSLNPSVTSSSNPLLSLISSPSLHVVIPTLLYYHSFIFSSSPSPSLSSLPLDIYQTFYSNKSRVHDIEVKNDPKNGVMWKILFNGNENIMANNLVNIILYKGIIHCKTHIEMDKIPIGNNEMIMKSYYQFALAAGNININYHKSQSANVHSNDSKGKGKKKNVPLSSTDSSPSSSLSHSLSPSDSLSPLLTLYHSLSNIQLPSILYESSQYVIQHSHHIHYIPSSPSPHLSPSPFLLSSPSSPSSLHLSFLLNDSLNVDMQSEISKRIMKMKESLSIIMTEEDGTSIPFTLSSVRERGKDIGEEKLEAESLEYLMNKLKIDHPNSHDSGHTNDRILVEVGRDGDAHLVMFEDEDIDILNENYPEKLKSKSPVKGRNGNVNTILSPIKINVNENNLENMIPRAVAMDSKKEKGKKIKIVTVDKVSPSPPSLFSSSVSSLSISSKGKEKEKEKGKEIEMKSEIKIVSSPPCPATAITSTNPYENYISHVNFLYSKWISSSPVLTLSLPSPSSSPSFSSSFSQYKNDFLPHIPSQWHVVTISLDHTATSMILSTMIRNSKSTEDHSERNGQHFHVKLWLGEGEWEGYGEKEKEKKEEKKKIVKGKTKEKEKEPEKEKEKDSSSSLLSSSLPFPRIRSSFLSLLSTNKECNKEGSTLTPTSPYVLRKSWWQRRVDLNSQMEKWGREGENEWWGAWKIIVNGEGRNGNGEGGVWIEGKLEKEAEKGVEMVMGKITRSNQMGVATMGESESSILRFLIKRMILNILFLSPMQIISILIQLFPHYSATSPPFPSSFSPAFPRNESSLNHFFDTFCYPQECREFLHSLSEMVFTSGNNLLYSTFNIEHPHLTNNITTETIINHENLFFSTVSRYPTILCMSNDLLLFPIENFPILRGQSCCREISWRIMLNHMKQYNIITNSQNEHQSSSSSCPSFLSHDSDGRMSGFSTDSSFWIINPGGDLASSQQRMMDSFGPHLQSKSPSSSSPQWPSIISHRPSHVEFISPLENNDIYVFCGHASGEQFLKQQRVFNGMGNGGGVPILPPPTIGKTMTVKKSNNPLIPTDLRPLSDHHIRSILLLMGCSSALLRHSPLSPFSPHGVILSYQVAATPCVVANLWDVTDGDIDRYTIRVIEMMMMGRGEDKDKDNDNHDDNTHGEMETIVMRGRKACKLRYLMGAAPVYYGIPIRVHGGQKTKITKFTENENEIKEREKMKENKEDSMIKCFIDMNITPYTSSSSSSSSAKAAKLPTKKAPSAVVPKKVPLLIPHPIKKDVHANVNVMDPFGDDAMMNEYLHESNQNTKNKINPKRIAEAEESDQDVIVIDDD